MKEPSKYFGKQKKKKILLLTVITIKNSLLELGEKVTIDL